MGFNRPQRLAKFEVAIFSHYRNIKGNHKFYGAIAILAQGHAHIFSIWDFMMGRGKQLHANSEVAGFGTFRKITGVPPKY